MSRNVFDQGSDAEDHEAAGDGPHVLLPPLDGEHHYEIKKLPSGRTAVIVEENDEVTDNPDQKPARDKFGRKYAN